MASSGSATPEAAVLLIPTVMCVVAAALLAPTIKKLIAKKTCSVELLYFDLPGLGEPIRLLLAHLGVAFEDRRFKARDEFLALKPTLKDNLRKLTPAQFERVLHPVFEEDELTLILIGRLMNEYAKGRTSKALSALMQMQVCCGCVCVPECASRRSPVACLRDPHSPGRPP